MGTKLRSMDVIDINYSYGCDRIENRMEIELTRQTRLAVRHGL